MSSGNSVTSPPPSPGPKYKLAEHRYGKEEMLALFSEDVEMPKELEMFDSICRNRPVLPLAFQPLTEEEQVRLYFVLLYVINKCIPLDCFAFVKEDMLGKYH